MGHRHGEALKVSFLDRASNAACAEQQFGASSKVGELLNFIRHDLRHVNIHDAAAYNGAQSIPRDREIARYDTLTVHLVTYPHGTTKITEMLRPEEVGWFPEACLADPLPV